MWQNWQSETCLPGGGNSTAANGPNAHPITRPVRVLSFQAHGFAAAKARTDKVIADIIFDFRVKPGYPENEATPPSALNTS